MARPRRQDQLQEPPICDLPVVDITRVRAAREAMPAVDSVRQMAELFAALGDPTRLRIVAALAVSDLCVCDLAATLSLSESATSHQLRVLRALGLVRPRREGRLVYYALDDDHVRQLFGQAREHVGHGIGHGHGGEGESRDG